MVTEAIPAGPRGWNRAQPHRSEPGYVFDFCGGQLAIDFTNTVGDRGSRPVEHFNTFGDVVAWAEARGVVSRGMATALRERASADSAGGTRAPVGARIARGALQRVRCRVLKTPGTTRGFERRQSACRRHIQERGACAVGRTVFARNARRRVARSRDPPCRARSRRSAHLGFAETHRPVRRRSCAWLFRDTTRGRTRRWCDMRACGNRNKVRRLDTRSDCFVITRVATLVRLARSWFPPAEPARLRRPRTVIGCARR